MLPREDAFSSKSDTQPIMDDALVDAIERKKPVSTSISLFDSTFDLGALPVFNSSSMYNKLYFADYKNVLSMFGDCTRHLFEDVYYNLQYVLDKKPSQNQLWLRRRINVDTSEETIVLFEKWKKDVYFGVNSYTKPFDIELRLGQPIDINLLDVLFSFRFFRRISADETLGCLHYDETLFENKVVAKVHSNNQFNKVVELFGSVHGLTLTSFKFQEQKDAVLSNRPIHSGMDLDDIDMLLISFDDEDSSSDEEATQAVCSKEDLVAFWNLKVVSAEKHTSNWDDFTKAMHDDWVAFMKSDH